MRIGGASLVVLCLVCVGCGSSPSGDDAGIDSGSTTDVGVRVDAAPQGDASPQDLGPRPDVPGCVDRDGDGASDSACGGDDCDDNESRRAPGLTEVCDAADLDEDCNPATFGMRDVDGDSQVDARCCNVAASGIRACGTDCDDGRPGVSTMATEACNGIDDDCDGMIDEGVLVAGFVDRDRDLHGNPTMPLMRCPGTSGFATENDDCNDMNVAIHGAQLEICDGIDNDCDMMIDESPATATWYRDGDGDGFGDARGSGVISSCTPVMGFSLLATDCDDMRSGVSPAADEQCNGRDDDCNGVADGVVAPGDLEDDDRDGFADARCMNGTDCDDRDPTTNPMAAEHCDGRDNDCDGMSDDGSTPLAWRIDEDGDGYADMSSTPVMICAQPRGHVLRVGDCDDSNRARSPGAPDNTCNGINEDCDTLTDEDAPQTAYFRDVDGDGFGSTTPVFACMRPMGVIVTGGDCNDMNMSVRPGATETCNGVDDDCDGMIDEGFAGMTETCGVGACRRMVSRCGSGMTMTCTPGMAMPEVCDGIDNDCDGSTDEEPAAADSCGDGSTIGECVTGTCRVLSCIGSTGDCNGIATDGCETDTATSTTHCGGCNRGCRAGDTCVDGACQNQPLQLTAGTAHTCVTLGSGNVYCWGRNNQGQLGDGTSLQRSRATRVMGTQTYVSVGSRIDHTCGVGRDRKVYCWGRNVNEQATGCPWNACAATPAQLTPIEVRAAASGSDPRKLALMDDTSCVLDSSGGVFCWGLCHWRQNAPNLCFGAIATGRVYSGARDIASGTSHVAVRTTGTTAECWSATSSAAQPCGTLNVNSDPHLARTMVTSAVVPLSDVAAMAGGEQFTCVVRVGAVMCAGDDTYGQLGNGAATNDARALNAVPSITDAQRVWAGAYHACAQRTNGEVQCWGRNESRQLGTASTALLEQSPAPITVTTSRIVDMALGARHSCAILETGRVLCWGDNSEGQLGDSTTMPRTGGVFVAGLP